MNEVFLDKLTYSVIDDGFFDKLIYSINGFFTEIFPPLFENLYNAYWFLLPILFFIVAYFVVLLIRRIRGD